MSSSQGGDRNQDKSRAGGTGASDYYARLIEANPIGDVARELLGDRITKETATDICIDCVRHASVSKTSFTISKEAGLWNCFGCGVGGDVIQLVEYVHHGVATAGVRDRMPDTHRAARDWLAKRVGMPPLAQANLSPEELERLERQGQEDEEVFQCLTAYAQLCHKDLIEDPKKLRWVRRKWGIRRKTIKRLRIGWAGDPKILVRLLDLGFSAKTIAATGAFVPTAGGLRPLYQKRIVFPYWSRGRVVYMIGRQTPWTAEADYEKAKYKKLPVFDEENEQKKHISRAITNSVLFGEDILLSRPDRLVITEGVTDAIASIQAGKATISPVTTRLKNDSFGPVAARLRTIPQVVILQDNEISDIGLASALDTALALEKEGVRCRVAILPLGSSHEAARARIRVILGEEKWKALQGAKPAARKKILKEGVPEEFHAEIDELIEKGKIDLCEWLRDNRPAGLEAILDAARPPLELLIEQAPIRENQIEQVDAVSGLLLQIGKRAPAESDHYLKLLSKRIEVPLKVLRPEASQRTKKAKSEERERARRARVAIPMPYTERDGCLVLLKERPNGVDEVVLTNFLARIVTKIVEDDGEQTTASLEIEAELHGRVHRFVLTTSAFAPMSWVIPKLGPTAIVAPGFSLRDHARAAIQHRSRDIGERRVYTHLGWTKHPEFGWVYLHNGGGIGAQGLITSIETQLPGDLEAYILPEPPTGENLKAAVRQSLAILTLAPDHIVIPVLGAVYRSVLGGTDFTIFLVGETGIAKTELAILGQGHFGTGFRDATGTLPPGSWESTENVLEALSFTGKDAVFVIDDFKPKGSSYDVQRWHAKADRIIRGQGNRRGRQRMAPDCTIQATKYPRGLVIATGEDTPRGESARARTLVLNVEKGDVCFDKLTILQNAARDGDLARCMSAHLQDVARNYEGMQRRLYEERTRLRDKYTREGQHRRTPGIIADLIAGFELFVDFAERAEAISKEEAEEYRRRSRAALERVMEDQAGTVAEESPATRFIECLRAVLLSGSAYLTLLDKDGNSAGVDITDVIWGGLKGVSAQITGSHPTAKRIGWLSLEKGMVFLDPQLAFSEVQDLSRSQGDSFQINLKTLERRLAKEGLIAVEESRDRSVRFRPKADIDGSRKRVMHLHLSALFPPPEEPGQPGRPGRASTTTDGEGPYRYGDQAQNRGTTGAIGADAADGEAANRGDRGECPGQSQEQVHRKDLSENDLQSGAPLAPVAPVTRGQPRGEETPPRMHDDAATAEQVGLFDEDLDDESEDDLDSGVDPAVEDSDGVGRGDPGRISYYDDESQQPGAKP